MVYNMWVLEIFRVTPSTLYCMNPEPRKERSSSEHVSTLLFNHPRRFLFSSRLVLRVDSPLTYLHMYCT